MWLILRACAGRHRTGQETSQRAARSAIGGPALEPQTPHPTVHSKATPLPHCRLHSKIACASDARAAARQNQRSSHKPTRPAKPKRPQQCAVIERRTANRDSAPLALHSLGRFLQVTTSRFHPPSLTHHTRTAPVPVLCASTSKRTSASSSLFSFLTTTAPRIPCFASTPAVEERNAPQNRHKLEGRSGS